MAMVSKNKIVIYNKVIKTKEMALKKKERVREIYDCISQHTRSLLRQTENSSSYITDIFVYMYFCVYLHVLYININTHLVAI